MYLYVCLCLVCALFQPHVFITPWHSKAFFPRTSTSWGKSSTGQMKWWRLGLCTDDVSAVVPTFTTRASDIRCVLWHVSVETGEIEGQRLCRCLVCVAMCVVQLDECACYVCESVSPWMSCTSVATEDKLDELGLERATKLHVSSKPRCSIASGCHCIRCMYIYAVYIYKIDISIYLDL